MPQSWLVGSTWYQLELSEKKEPQLRNYFPKAGLRQACAAFSSLVTGQAGPRPWEAGPRPWEVWFWVVSGRRLKKPWGPSQLRAFIFDFCCSYGLQIPGWFSHPTYLYRFCILRVESWKKKKTLSLPSCFWSWSFVTATETLTKAALKTLEWAAALCYFI